MTRLPHEWPVDPHDPKVCTHCHMVYGEELIEGEECAIRLRAALDEAIATACNERGIGPGPSPGWRFNGRDWRRGAVCAVYRADGGWRWAPPPEFGSLNHSPRWQHADTARDGMRACDREYP